MCLDKKFKARQIYLHLVRDVSLTCCNTFTSSQKYQLWEINVKSNSNNKTFKREKSPFKRRIKLKSELQ